MSHVVILLPVNIYIDIEVRYESVRGNPVGCLPRDHLKVGRMLDKKCNETSSFLLTFKWIVFSKSLAFVFVLLVL